MFDCVLPTRSGRTGLAFTWNGKINIKNCQIALLLKFETFSNKYPNKNPLICASHEILLLCIAIRNCENNQKIIKNFAFIVVGNGF